MGDNISTSPVARALHESASSRLIFAIGRIHDGEIPLAFAPDPKADDGNGDAEKRADEG
jgi:hypothetical protein